MKNCLSRFNTQCRWLVILALSVISIFSAVARPYGLNSVPPVGPFLNNVLPEVAPAISGNWSAVVAFTNLLFTNSVGLTHVPDTNQLCVWEREGRVWTFENSPGATEKKLVLDIHDQCQGWDDSGLLGVAFHPGFATNHFMFVYYTWVKPGTVAGDRQHPARIRFCPTPITTGSNATRSTLMAWPFPAR